MKRIWIGLAGAVTWAIAGSADLIVRDAPPHVIHQTVACPTVHHTPAKGLQILGTHRWARGVVVLYSGLCPAKNAKAPLQRVLGHQVVQQDGMNWQVSSSDSYGTRDEPKPAVRLIDYGVSHSESNPNFTSTESDRYTILYGQILTPKVTAIEATFNTGQILRDDGSSGTFALVAVGATRICELRILGIDNQVLRQQEWPESPDLFGLRVLVRQSQRSPRCLPLSQQ